jgi:HTH-type transcriptional regulator/antitoxin HigA
LEYATGTPARWWLRLEADYQAAVVRLAQGELADSDLAWIKSMPVRELVAAGAIPESPSRPAHRLRQLLKFFGVASVDSYWLLWREPAAAFRQSGAFTIKDSAVTAWLRLGELAAQKLGELPPFDPDGLRAELPHLRKLTADPPRQGFQSLVGQCHRFGVAVIAVPEVTGARAFGATRWLNAGRRPLIQLSLRGKTDNTLWLTVFHELAHVLLHDRKSVFIESEEAALQHGADVDREEREANQFAWRTLIPEPYELRLSTLHSEVDVLDLADELGIAASLVVARLEFEGRWHPRQGARLKRPVDFDLLLSDAAFEVASGTRARRTGRGLPGGDSDD